MGNEFDYVCLSALGRFGGLCVAWRRDSWVVSDSVCRTFSITVSLAPIELTSRPWSLCAVYGPVRDDIKEQFLNEIRAVKVSVPGPFLICGDFNQIYQAADKNNDRLDYRSMCRFRRLIDEGAVLAR